MKIYRSLMLALAMLATLAIPALAANWTGFTVNTMGAGVIPMSDGTTPGQFDPSSLSDDGTKVTGTEPIFAISVISVPNSASGTTVNMLATLSGSGGSLAATTTQTNDTSFSGIVVAGAGNTGNALIAKVGTVPCVFDGATTAGQYVQRSGTVTGNCTAVATVTNHVVGRVTTTNASAGTYNVALGGEDATGVTSGMTFPGPLQAAAPRQYSGATDTLSASDCGISAVHSTGSAAVTETVPNNLPVGCNISLEQIGSGVVTVVAATGATPHSPCATIATNHQNATLWIHVETNTTGTNVVYNVDGRCT